MRKDIFGLSKKFVQDTDPEECLDNFESMRVIPSDNPVYEDPRDVLEKSTKSIRKRSPKLTKDIKAIIKDHKKKLTKKYEGLIVTLMEKCEENILVISERESQLVKLKQKLKEVLEYNKLFAEENDQIKSQYSTMVGYVEDCKRVIEELKVHNKDLEDEVKLHQVPEKEVSTAIPLVEICISCNSRDILLRQARDHNSRLHSDMQALKDVLYRLNVQLSRYQEKIRSSVQSISKDTHDNIITIHKPEPGLESFLTSGFKVPDIGNTRDHGTTKGIQDDGDQSQRTKMVDVSGLLSAQALGPLFDAYQEAIQEKENLILDYEKQFEIMNRKTKTVVDENKDLKDKIQATEESNNSMRQNVKKFTVEKETYDIERATLLERCEKVEAKLKEVYELYEDKMAAMMRDYETVHREYFATKNSLSAAENRITQLDAALRAPSLRTVPADLHERRVDNCKRLLDDLKHQYGMEIERKNELISKLQHEKTVLEDKHKQLTTEHEANCEELKIALKNVILYRKAAKIFRQRYKCSMSTIQTLRRSRRRNRALNRLSAPPVTPTLERLDKIKQEIKQVKSCAYNSLSELERRMVQQERGAARDLMIQRREAQRLQLLVEHKEHIIKHLIDKVADVEEVRLSQGSSRVLQGVPDSPPERPPKVEARDLKRDPVKLVPGPGGYFHGDTREGEDSSYPACELNSHGPASRGWRSLGPPPHELLLRLENVATVHKLQLLAHHQLVPECVEVLVSGGLLSCGAATPCGAVYTSVGRVALAKPLPQARTRELRSAALTAPTAARFVKLRLSAPHPPALEHDQVALMAVNILGDEVEEILDPTSPSGQILEQYCPYDDLAFVMYVDTDVADLVRRLEAKKKDAVAEERFEYARRLKSASTALTSAGVRIGRWRLRKRIAAAKDDFELARRMRDRICEALTGISEDGGLCRLFEVEGQSPENDTSMLQEYDFSHHLAPPQSSGLLSADLSSPLPPHPPEGDETDVAIRDEKTTIPYEEPIVPTVEPELESQNIVEEELIRRETDSPRRSITPNAANGGVLVRRRNKSAGPRSTFEAYEERLLPALRHSHTNEFLKETKEEESSTTGSATQARPTHKLNERERKQAALPILIFGYPLVEKLYSKTYLDKEEGLTRLKAELTEPSTTSTSPNKTARAASALLQRALRDKVFSVYSHANEVVKVLFRDYMANRVCPAEIGRCVDKILPELLRACGDPAPRIHSTAQHTVLTVAECAHVRSLHLIPQQLVRPINAAMHPRLALSRLQMLEQLLLSHGISTDKNSGLTVRRLAECGASGTQHASGAVRAAAERILLAAYNRSPRVVRAQLPPDDAVTRRNLIYRHLFQQFDRIDMQRMLNQAPSEDNLQTATEKSISESLETASLSQSTRSITISGMTTSLGPTSYTTKSMTSSASGTLAPSSLSSFSTRSSLKKSPTKRYSLGKTTRDFENYPGYNKLRLDSAVSPKHSPRSSINAEKVHFQETKGEVIYRRTNRNSENRHSMIHYDHDTNKPMLKERPITVFEPLHVDYRDSPCSGSPKASRQDLMTQDSLDSPQFSQINLDKPDFYRSLDSPKTKQDYKSPLDSPKIVSGIRNLHLEDNREMDESGYYSPGDTRGRSQGPVKSKSGVNVAEYCDLHFDSFEGHADVSSEGTTPEPVCNMQCTWCGCWVRAGAMDAHYWRRCVVLARCQHCQQALEARALHAHLLEECSMSEGCWKPCHKCGAALRVDEEYHATCIPLGPDEWKCPYCLMNVLARDLPWQRHLIQCPRNPRVASKKQ